MSKLPRPVTTAEKYLAAILDALQQGQEQVADDETVELREVEQPIYTDLTKDFPGYDALVKAGIIYLESVPRNGDALVEIPGIGKATANRILTWFKT